jgi:hypothetical protein
VCVISRHVIIDKFHFVLDYPSLHFLVFFIVKSPRPKSVQNLFKLVRFITIDYFETWRRYIGSAGPLMLILFSLSLKLFEAFVASNNGVMSAIMTPAFVSNIELSHLCVLIIREKETKKN